MVAHKPREELAMRTVLLTLAAGLCAAVTSVAAAAPTTDPERPWRLSGGFAHENLQIFLVHGRSFDRGPAPMPLGEALAKGMARVHETGDVNRLMVENLSGDRAIYIESGDIVKGGKQDRLLTVDLILEPKSGPVPIASFCVEQGRWRQRGGESAAQFSGNHAAAPGKDMKILTRKAGFEDSAAKPAAQAQGQVWREVAGTMDKLSSTLGKPVAAAESRSSLQLALENKELKQRIAQYVAALAPAIDGHDDVVGFAFAVNGKVNSAEVYGSPELFAKRWLRLLEAAAIEAVAERHGALAAAAHPVPIETVARFLSDAEAAQPAERVVGGRTRWAKRESSGAVMFESRAAAGEGFVHRSYLAK
jgi:hypothetical protein